MGGTAVQDLNNTLGVDTEAVIGGAGVEEAVACTDPGTHCDGCGALEYGLCSFVVAVPMLLLVAEEKRYAFDVHFPGRVEMIVNVCESPYRRREMTRITNGSVEEIWELFTMLIIGRRA